MESREKYQEECFIYLNNFPKWGKKIKNKSTVIKENEKSTKQQITPINQMKNSKLK